MWTTKTIEKPVVKYEMTHGPLQLRIDEEDATYLSGKRWKYISLSLGQFTDDDIEACKAYWPREAIAAVRKALDAFEATL